MKELDKIIKDNEELNSKIKELQESNKNVQTEYENDKLVGLDEQLKALKEKAMLIYLKWMKVKNQEHLQASNPKKLILLLKIQKIIMDL